MDAKMPIIIIAFIFAFISFIFSIGSEEIPETYYGELWNKSDEGFTTIDLVTIDTYVQITELNEGLSNKVTINESDLIIQSAGLYKINAVASIVAGGNSEFGLKLFINDTGQDNCYSHAHGSSSQTDIFSITCFLELNIGDRIGLYLDDHTNPPNDAVFNSANINILKIDS